MRFSVHAHIPSEDVRSCPRLALSRRSNHARSPADGPENRFPRLDFNLS